MYVIQANLSVLDDYKCFIDVCQILFIFSKEGLIELECLQPKCIAKSGILPICKFLFLLYHFFRKLDIK